MLLCTTKRDVFEAVANSKRSLLTVAIPATFVDESLSIIDDADYEAWSRGELGIPRAVAIVIYRAPYRLKGFDEVILEIVFFNCPDDLVRRFMEES